MLRTFLPFAFLLALPSCGALSLLQERGQIRDFRGEVAEGNQKLNERIDGFQEKLNTGIDGIQQDLGDLEQTWTAAHEAADVNKDGKVEGGYEQLLLLLGGGGALAEMMRRKLKGLDGKIEHERVKRKAVEAKLP